MDYTWNKYILCIIIKKLAWKHTQKQNKYDAKKRNALKENKINTMPK